MVRHSPKNVLMHFALPDNPSLLLWGKCQKCLLRTGRGFFCAWCCQITSKHSVTFGKLKKNFYLHAKFNLGTKSLSVSYRTVWIHLGYKNNALKGDEYINNGGDQFISCLYGLWITNMHYSGRMYTNNTLHVINIELFVFWFHAIYPFMQWTDPLYSYATNFSRTQTCLISKTNTTHFNLPTRIT